MKRNIDPNHCTRCNWEGTWGETYSDLHMVDFCPNCGAKDTVKTGKPKQHKLERQGERVSKQGGQNVTLLKESRDNWKEIANGMARDYQDLLKHCDEIEAQCEKFRKLLEEVSNEVARAWGDERSDVRLPGELGSRIVESLARAKDDTSD